MKYKIDEVLSSGYIMGDCILYQDKYDKSSYSTKEFELIRFKHSINKTKEELDEIKSNNLDLEEFLETQKLIATDPILIKRVTEEIENGKRADEALEQVMAQYVMNILKSSSSYLRERANDINDVLNRLITNLEMVNKYKADDKYILVIDNLFPSILIQRRKNLLGVISKSGGYTSHAAILCRSFDIPYVVSNIECENDDTIIIDTRINQIIVSPTEKEKNDFLYHKEMMNENKKILEHDSNFKFLANVSNNDDVKIAKDYNFDGVGLYRTEMIFMDSNKPYTFLDQYSIYSDAIELMKDKRIVFRTFDVGSDKNLEYLKSTKKGIDNYLSNPDLFEVQVKAILKANKYDNVSIMFPIIYNNNEFEYLKDWVKRIANKNGYKMPKIGMMLETKEALFRIEEFSPDFISIGTNDLSYELYGIKRDELVDYKTYAYDLVNELIPVVNYAKRKNIELSICGELASIPDVAIKFYEIGIRNLSVSPSLGRMLNLAYNQFTNN